MQWLIEDVIQALGWAVLKTITAGRYRGRGQADLLMQGSVGLATIAVTCWAAYRWWT